MSKVLVLYCSSYGHIETMAVIKRVPEFVPEEIARKSGIKLDQAAPIATVDELPEYDAIIFGTPTRFGNMTAQMRNFLGQTGLEEIKGGSPYGAATLTGGDGSRMPSAVELEGARFQGRHVAQIAAKLARPV